MIIRLHDPNNARACIQWLIKNVGPHRPGITGPVLHGTGWNSRSWCNDTGCMFEIEITKDVDEETAMIFALKWAE